MLRIPTEPCPAIMPRSRAPRSHHARNRERDTRMQNISKDLARQTSPWRAGQSWWVVGVQGIIALAIGVFMLANPTRAGDVIRFLIALVLLLDSLGHIVDGFRDRRLASAPWDALRGG